MGVCTLYKTLYIDIKEGQSQKLLHFYVQGVIGHYFRIEIKEYLLFT